MYTAIIVIIIIASILLGLVVLMQNSKGGGLASGFSSSSQFMGVRKTTDFLEKATWILAVTIVVLCFASSFLTSDMNKEGDGTEIKSKAQSATATTATQPLQANPEETFE